MSGYLWDFFVDRLIILFMPLVCSYFAFCGDLFFNLAASDAEGLEKIGNEILIPVQYLFAGREALRLNPEDPNKKAAWKFRQRFEYETNFWPKTIASVIALPPSLILGGCVKMLTLFSEKGRLRFSLIAQAELDTESHSNLAQYQKIGIAIPETNQYEWVASQNYKRRPGDETHLASAKELLAEISALFNEAQIPWWVDCGTCLGTYRYGGVIPWDGDVDIAVLLPDFENVKKTLNRLDPKKYHVQNWSGRCMPNSYFKIFIRQTASTIDIGFFSIDSQKQEVQCIFALEHSLFFPEWVKIRERRFSAPAPFSMIFPLKKAFFDGVQVFVPNQTKSYLQRCYGENLDPAKIYNPKTRRFEPDLTHPYWQRQYVH